jgi:1A family penicillin-binding protein
VTDDFKNRLDALRARAARWWTEARQGKLRTGSVLLVVAAVALVIFFSSVGAALAAWTRACANGCPDASDLVFFEPHQSSEVYGADGELIAVFRREHRRVISIGDLPPHVPLAFVAIEDQRFFHHSGIDARRFMGAVRDNVFGGFGATGGSTITMQLARDLFPQQLPRTETSVRRKVAEMRLALDMEQSLSKSRILELYLNNINLGAGAYGVEAAARTYFDKPASELDYLEAATLAGLPQAPSRYNPRRNPDLAEQRRNRVLRFMAQTGVITEEQMREGQETPIALAPVRGVLRAPYFVENIRRQLEDELGDLIYTAGLRIHTTLDTDLQRATEEAMEEQLRAIEQGRYGRFPHPKYSDLTEEQRAERADGTTLYLQGTAIMMDPHTGEVRAMVGGRNFRHSQFNRATQALRQPGSAFKPFIYAALLEAGRSPMYRISDERVVMRMEDGRTWSPRNYDGQYGGLMTAREALRQSRNMPAIRAGQEAGIDEVRAMAQRAGLATNIPSYPSVFLGAADVYPMDMVIGYATFANGGYRVQPRLIERIEDHEGNLLYEPESVRIPAVDPATAWIITDMLREVVDRGTGYSVRNPQVGNLPYNIPAAGKTGTTNSAADIWFVGYTPDYVGGVWFGMDRPQQIMPRATGGTMVAPVWARIMRSAYEGREPPREWQRPSGVLQLTVDRYSGRAMTPDCIYAFDTFTDYFVASAAPEPVCEPPDVWMDPNPGLLGRPVYPGEPRVPREDQFRDRRPPR